MFAGLATLGNMWRCSVPRNSISTPSAGHWSDEEAPHKFKPGRMAVGHRMADSMLVATCQIGHMIDPPAACALPCTCGNWAVRINVGGGPVSKWSLVEIKWRGNWRRIGDVGSEGNGSDWALALNWAVAVHCSTRVVLSQHSVQDLVQFPLSSRGDDVSVPCSCQCWY